MPRVAATATASIVLLELKSSWEKDSLLQVLEYRIRNLLKFHLPITSCILLLKPCSDATDCYEDHEVRFQIRLLRVYEFDAREIVQRGLTCMMPFVPLMRHGRELLYKAEEMIYHSSMNRRDRADMLTSMAILSGLISDSLPIEIIRRRRDIMIESAAYDIIKREGYEEGMEKGLEKGLERAIRKMFLKGVAPSEIARLLELDPAMVQEICMADDNGRKG
uniref:Rpn family recombination-promoting nuclease/putative transposase n=1 Tax=Desulfatirhabdium butyrativorans TaxID=340467 RepID=A0A7C4VQZ5_9BACT